LKSYDHGSDTPEVSFVNELLKLEQRIMEKASEYAGIVKELWKELPTVNDPPFDHVIGIDGSVLKFPLKPTVLFVVTAVGVPHRVKAEAAKVKHREISMSGKVRPPAYIDERPIKYMETLELELAQFYSYYHSNGLVMGDGSISMMVKCPLPSRTCSRFKQAFTRFVEEVGEDFLLAEPKMVLEKLIEFADSLKDTYQDDYPQLVTCLECMWKEKVANYLSTTASHNKNVIYISKSYASNEILNDDEYNDIFIIDVASKLAGIRGPGMVGPFRYTVKLSGVGSDVVVLRGFVRFKKGAQVYYFEALGFEEEEIPNVLSFISSICSKGYPVPLILAHKRAELKRAKYLRLLKRSPVGFTGREPL